jgi:peptide/nickel transport system permease protein
VFASRLATFDPLAPALRERLAAPTPKHLLGTDGLGRDIFSRLVFGARYSLPVGLLSTALSLVLGSALGFLAGYYAASERQWVDTLTMRTMDTILAFPSFLLALMLVSALGPSLENAMLAVGIVGIPVFARLARGAVLATKTREYVTAAHVYGAGDLHILLRHILPNSVQPLIVQGTLGVGTAILTAAGLSFLGLGARPPAPEWGSMLNDGRAVLQTSPWVTVYPGLAILAAVLGINLIGDGLRDALDPRIRT